MNKNKSIDLAARLLKPTERHALERSNANNTELTTPHNILSELLSDMFGEVDQSKFNEFSAELTRRLSLLSTNQQDPEAFGADFNQLMQIFVISLNMLGKAKRIMDENGLEFPEK